MLLLILAGEGVELAGKSLVRLCENRSQAGRLSQQLQRLEASGFVAHEGSGPIDRRVFRLTAHGRSVTLGLFDPEQRWARAWSGSWTIVAFDVPEAQIAARTRLRRQLRQLRFGWLQNSVWITPDPTSSLSGFFGRGGISPESFSVFEGRPSGGENDADLVHAAWDFPKLERDYASYRKVLELRPASGQRDAAKWKKWADVEHRAWSQVCATDPFLPEVLLPAGYSGRKVWRQRLKALADIGSTLTGSGRNESAG